MHILLQRPEGKLFIVIYCKNMNSAFVLLLEGLYEVCHGPVLNSS